MKHSYRIAVKAADGTISYRTVPAQTKIGLNPWEYLKTQSYKYGNDQKVWLEERVFFGAGKVNQDWQRV